MRCDRVEEARVPHDDADPGDERGSRAGGVQRHVQHGAAHVQAVPGVPLEDDRTERRSRRDPAPATTSRPAPSTCVRLADAPDRFVDDPAGRGEQQDGVRLRADHLGALEAERVLRGRRTADEPLRDERDRERGDVRDHVRAVGEQREGAEEHAADELDDEERAVGDERDGSARSRRS